MKLAELGQVSGEGAMEPGFVAADFIEGLLGGTALLQDGVGVAAVLEGSGGILGIPTAEDGEDVPFNAKRAAEAPSGRDDAFGEKGFERAIGGEARGEGSGEFLEFGLAFLREDEVAGEQPMAKRVLRGRGLPVGSTGARAELGVDAIGGELFFGEHGGAFLRTESGRGRV